MILLACLGLEIISSARWEWTTYVPRDRVVVYFPLLSFEIHWDIVADASFMMVDMYSFIDD